VGDEEPGRHTGKVSVYMSYCQLSCVMGVRSETKDKNQNARCCNSAWCFLCSSLCFCSYRRIWK